MAQTHDEVVKVWIAPGCIVCDACEAEAPEVFEVQEETCVIRPEAQSADFTKPLTPSIIAAAEGCPVDVIKFETVAVEGPEPWAGQKEEAAAEGHQSKAAGGGSKKPAVEIPTGPPDPKWAALLATSRTSGSRSAAGATVRSQPIDETSGNGTGHGHDHGRTRDRLPARVPAQAIAEALPRHAPPDARSAAMVGTGFARPRDSAVERIRARAAELAGSARVTRRQFSYTVAAAWACLAAVGATLGAALQSFLVPKVSFEPPSTFRAGRLSDFSDDGVYEQHKGSQGVWIVRERGQLVALSTICTHLGCIPNWLPTDQKFKCPCHGSGFYMTGVNFEGPAPRPLERYRIMLDGEYVVVDKSMKFRQELGQWDNPASFVQV